jgi:chromosome segregation ATPase
LNLGDDDNNEIYSTEQKIVTRLDLGSLAISDDPEEEPLEKQDLEFSARQELDLPIEYKEDRLSENLGSKLEECNSKITKLNNEKSKLRIIKQKLDKQMEKNNKNELKFASKVEKLKAKSLKIKSEHRKLKEDTKKFKNKVAQIETRIKAEMKKKLAEKVTKFENRIKAEIKKKYTNKVSKLEERMKADMKKKLTKKFQTTKTKLDDGWVRLHAEEQKLSEIYNDICSVKKSFKDKFLAQLQGIKVERAKLSKEWRGVKKIRKGLEAERKRLNPNYKISDHDQPEIAKALKDLKVKDDVLADLESKLRSEISKQITREHEESATQLEQEWKKLRAEQKKLVKSKKVRIKKLKAKAKDGFDTRLKKLKKISKIDNQKKAELEAMEAEFRAEEKKRSEEQASEEKRKKELNDMALNLEEQQKELNKERERLAKEWNYIDRVKENIQTGKSKSTQTEHTDSDTIEVSNTRSESKSELEDMSGDELTRELEGLQAELKQEWTELRQQHDRLREAKKVFSSARTQFEKLQDRKMMRFDKIPIAQLGFDRSQ